MKKEKPKLDMAAVLIQSMQELVDGLNGRGPKLTVRTYEIPEPPVYSAKKVKAIRARVGLSQALFAQLVGVSKKLVEAWESGARKPSTMASRLLEAIDRTPERYVRVSTSKGLPKGRRRVA